jgi:hypothetical protein
MKSRWSALILLLVGGPAFAQVLPELPSESCQSPAALGELSARGPNAFSSDEPAPQPRPTGCIAGNHNYPGFIGWMSNLSQNIDPRAVTALYPVFGSAWYSAADQLPDGNFQVYGVALTVALSERLAVGLNQGGYTVANLRGGDRSGWLNLGGFAQYTVIEDVADQFLLTAGIRWEAPSGSRDLFQGIGPTHLAGYLTAGQECGPYHVLATGGYEFPVENEGHGAEFFYGNVHIDRCIHGCIYPLVEVNWTYHEHSVEFASATLREFFNLGNFTAEGNIVTLAAGADWVIVRECLELGAVYQTVLASQHNFELNAVLVKLMLRF